MVSCGQKIMFFLNDHFQPLIFILFRKIQDFTEIGFSRYCDVHNFDEEKCKCLIIKKQNVSTGRY